MNIQPGDRVLGDRFIKNLESRLSEVQFSSISVTAVLGDQEAFRFATQIMNYLVDKGYEAGGVLQAVFNQPVGPQVIQSPDENGVLKIIIGGRR